MADTPVIVASEVVIPDEFESQYNDLPAKRRQSQASNNSNKRPRLIHDEPIKQENSVHPTSVPKKALSERRASGQMDERRRGKRLFGALLGTLAQSSSSTANKRRVDIEKKQREKLKQQTDEYDEIKKRKLDALMDIRWQEQKKYDKQSVQLRHSNLLASAHFLQTKAEPKLYYKPWEQLPSDEARIKSQIEYVEALIEKETAEFMVTEEEPIVQGAQIRNGTTIEYSLEIDSNAKSENLDEDANIAQVSPKADTFTNVESESPNNDTKYTQCGLGGRRSSADDSGEIIVEGVEDTVIY